MLSGILQPTGQMVKCFSPNKEGHGHCEIHVNFAWRKAARKAMAYSGANYSPCDVIN
jgi:hypothetical protein